MGIPDREVVRLGSARKATFRTERLSMYQATSTIKLTQDQMNMLASGRTHAKLSGTCLEDAFKSYREPVVSKTDILEHLEFREEGPPFFAAFEAPTQPGNRSRLGKKGRPVDEYYLLDRWIRGKDGGVFRWECSKGFPEVWNMKSELRIRLLNQWKAEIQEGPLNDLQTWGTAYNEALEKMEHIQAERELTILRMRRIIACTTTAAAKYVKRIQSISPGVLIVEEAGEILESHILTALGPSTKQLILIGDHKQLRPSVHYDLSVEKGDGYDLNRSLFERLVLQGYPHNVLFQQHRMRPEIARFVQGLTYPDLTNAPGTQHRPETRGMQDNVVFLDHRENEVDMVEFPDWKDATTMVSKQNIFEAKMALKCVRYLAQQDYKTDQIVILTAYLGQLRTLMDELGKENDPVLNDLDSHELVRAGLMPSASAQVDKPKIRLSTIGKACNFPTTLLKKTLILMCFHRQFSRRRTRHSYCIANTE